MLNIGSGLLSTSFLVHGLGVLIFGVIGILAILYIQEIKNIKEKNYGIRSKFVCCLF